MKEFKNVITNMVRFKTSSGAIDEKNFIESIDKVYYVLEDNGVNKEYNNGGYKGLKRDEIELLEPTELTKIFIYLDNNSLLSLRNESGVVFCFFLACSALKMYYLIIYSFII